MTSGRASRRRSLRWLVAGLGLALAASACGGSDERFGIPGVEVTTIEGDLLPASVLGLDVAREDVAEPVSSIESTYVRALSVYSFRRDELLQATLQVGELGDDADYTNRRFRLGLVNQIGGSQPREVRLGEQPVWLTTGTNQQLSVWFNDRRFFVLARRADFEQPRKLLREILERDL